MRLCFMIMHQAKQALQHPRCWQHTCMLALCKGRSTQCSPQAFKSPDCTHDGDNEDGGGNEDGDKEGGDKESSDKFLDLEYHYLILLPTTDHTTIYCLLHALTVYNLPIHDQQLTT